MNKTSSQVLKFRRASREVVRELGFLQNNCLSSGVTHSESHALLELERQGTLTVAEIAEILRLDKSTASRLVDALIHKGWIEATRDEVDKRRKPIVLSRQGRNIVGTLNERATHQVTSALQLLSSEDRAKVLDGMALYALALQKARRAAQIERRPVRKGDNAALAAIIRQVMPEFGASGPGFAIHDPEVNDMAAAYRRKGCAYFVVTQNDRVVGGGGVAPLDGGAPGVCEIRKMYFLPEARGLGVGRQLFDHLLCVAKKLGYRKCYLETLKNMTRARELYEKNGFAQIDRAMGNTGHFGCDTWYVRKL